MKKVFIRDLLVQIKNGQCLNQEGSESTPIELFGWVTGRRCLGKIIFLDLEDSTGILQAVVKEEGTIVPVFENGEFTIGDDARLSDDTAQNEIQEREIASLVSNGKGSAPGAENVFELAKKVTPESSVRVTGEFVAGPSGTEFSLKSLQVLGGVVKPVSPHPHRNFDISDSSLTEHCLTNRHLYLRHPRLKALLELRHEIVGAVHEWFRANRYIQFDAPVLTPLPLYDDSTAMSIEVNDQKVFLTQCVGFYLDAAAHVFEKVYNIGPSFRGEESRSLRHLMEYWHIKAEIAWASREDTIQMVENLIQHITNHVGRECTHIWETLGESPSLQEGLAAPFPRLSYPEAVEILQRAGENFPFGTSLGTRGENILAARFNTPFWVVGNPRSIEPFPYCIDPDDERLTLTADLILPRGYGELLGVAEKIYRPEELEMRLTEKGKGADERYEWVQDLRKIGSVPRGAFGMGLERLIRWIANVSHVRDCIAFPRVFRRQVYP